MTGPAADAAPTVATIAGVEVVTIPLTHYAELLDCRRQLAAAQVSPERLRANVRSRVERDPEVAAFLTERLGRELLKDAHSACVARFGPERSPSPATIGRFWDKLGRGRR